MQQIQPTFCVNNNEIFTMEIDAFGLDWHVDRSKAVDDWLIEPLLPFASIHYKVWDGRVWSYDQDSQDNPIIFCQYPPPPVMLAQSKARLVWVPMWDYVHGFSQEWWNSLPKTLRVVAFSSPVYDRATRASLPTLRLKYFKDPSTLSAVDWTHSRVLLYWNRMGLYRRQFLEKMCSSLNIETLIFQSTLDRAFSRRVTYKLQRTLGSTVVQGLTEHVLSREDYLARTRMANIYLAPRDCEGIGMAFLEAMARGAAVFAFDGPTMNEYILNGYTGYLFRPVRKKFTFQRLGHFVDRAFNIVTGGPKLGFAQPISEKQDWKEISGLDLRVIGEQAAESHRLGFTAWQQSISDYAKFILDW